MRRSAGKRTARSSKEQLAIGTAVVLSVGELDGIKALANCAGTLVCGKKTLARCRERALK